MLCSWLDVRIGLDQLIVVGGIARIVLIDCIFFFKQKTAYEMRISDWSSDVCSSDLRHRWPRKPPVHQHRRRPENRACAFRQAPPTFPDRPPKIGRASCRERVCQYV